LRGAAQRTSLEVAHDLIVDPTERLILHHNRGIEGTILTYIVRVGVIVLDPPGLQLF